MKIAIVSGGTGGHIYPGIAIADEVRARDPKAEILFFGSTEGLEQELVRQAGYSIKLIRSRALLRKISYKAISAPFVSAIGFFQAIAALRSFSPNVLFSTGGYASMPVVLAAWVLRVPIVIHEQNVLPGAVNRFCSRFAKRICLSFPESLQYLKGEVTGNPVRKEILNANKEAARAKFKIGPSNKVLLVMGGSQGSKKINQVMISAIANIPENVEVLHIIGSRDFDWVDRHLADKAPKNYHPISYLHGEMADALAAADMAVSRAGATAIAEFLVRGLPMILIPFPYAAEDHQRLNAKAIAEAGAALVLEETDLTPDKIINFPPNHAKMINASRRLARPDAAGKIVDLIYAA